MNFTVLFLIFFVNPIFNAITMEQQTEGRSLPDKPTQQHWDPSAYQQKFNPHLQSVMGSHPINYLMYQQSGPYAHMLMNPMMNPMMMNPYMMGMSVMGMGSSMMGGLGMMMPGMSMYPFMNPYLGYQGPYGPNSPYNSGEDRKLLDEAEPPKISNQVN